MQKNNYKLTVIITTSHQYAFLISECVKLINLSLKKFIDKIYIVSDQKKEKNINLADNCKFYFYKTDWSSRLISLLKEINNENLLLLTEDTFIEGFDKKYFNYCLKKFYLSKTLYLRFVPINKNINSKNNLFSLPKLTPYRFSALGFWKKNVLKNILLPSENPWEFEIMGSYRTRSYDNGFFYPNKKILNILNIVEKGFITNQGHNYLKSISHKDINRLPKMNKYQSIKTFIIKIIFKRIYLINWEKRLFIMNKFRKLFVTY